MQIFTQREMDKSRNKHALFFNGINSLSKWIRRMVFIIFAALMIGFNNAFNDECRMINDINNFSKQEQVIDDEDTNE